MVPTRKIYNGFVIQVASFNGSLGRPGRVQKWGEWYPAYRIYREGAPQKIACEGRLDHAYQSKEEADRSALTAAEAWIDDQKKES